MDDDRNEIKKRRLEILVRYSFEWDGLINEVLNLNFNDYEGSEKGFCWVKLPDFSNSYGLQENKVLFPGMQAYETFLNMKILEQKKHSDL